VVILSKKAQKEVGEEIRILPKPENKAAKDMKYILEKMQLFSENLRFLEAAKQQEAAIAKKQEAAVAKLQDVAAATAAAAKQHASTASAAKQHEVAAAAKQQEAREAKERRSRNRNKLRQRQQRDVRSSLE
jgi:hypothetical protein